MSRYSSLCVRLKGIKRMASRKELTQYQIVWICGELDSMVSRLPFIGGDEDERRDDSIRMAVADVDIAGDNIINDISEHKGDDIK